MASDIHSSDTTPIMTSNRLSKVAKHIAKKKGGKKALHENSRDTQRLQRAGALDEKLNKLAGVRKRQNQPYCLCSLLLDHVL